MTEPLSPAADSMPPAAEPILKPTMGSAPEPSAPQVSRRAARVPHWRVVVLALVIAAFAGEQVWFLSSNSAASRPSVRPAPHATLAQHIASLAAQALGPSDRGVPRFRLTGLRALGGPTASDALTLTWAINGDLSLGSVSSEAQLEVYLLLRSFYTARLPLGSVRLTGTFGALDRRGRHLEVPVMVVGMDAATARLIDWQDLDASNVWPLVHRYMIRPGFECQCQE